MDRIVLSTGRSIYANRCILGLDEELNLYDGYDGEIQLEEYNIATDSMQQVFTDRELAEIADIMIARWQQFKQRSTKSGE